MLKDFKDVEVIKERDKTLFIYPMEPGKMQRIDEFWTIRAGVSWPTAKSPGYYCIIGAKDDLEAADRVSLVLIDEGQSGVREKLFEKIMLNTKESGCERIYARLDGNKSPERAYYRFRRQRNIDCPGLLDSSEFENFNQDVLLIRQWIEKGALKVPPNSCLGEQLANLKADDVNENFEVKFYAVAAFCRVLKSLDIYPFQRGGRRGFQSGGGSFGFTNLSDRNKPKDTNGYWETTVD
jgi:hypothetical protein